jgi:hypothetical protein
VTRPYRLSSSSVLPGPPEAAFRVLLEVPLEEFFPTRSGVIPAVRRCEGQKGPWGRVGQSRTVHLADGNRNVETVVAVDPPHDYRYAVTDFTGPMGRLARRIDGRLRFESDGAQTRATWEWVLVPAHPAARLFLPVIGASWRSWARTMWPRFAARLSA